jgi:hypothetical protein
MLPNIAVPIARMQTIVPIIRGRGVRLLSTRLRSIPCNRTQSHLRTQPPNTQLRNMRLTRAPARRRLTMSTTRSRRTNNPSGETNLLS